MKKILSVVVFIFLLLLIVSIAKVIYSGIQYKKIHPQVNASTIEYFNNLGTGNFEGMYNLMSDNYKQKNSFEVYSDIFSEYIKTKNINNEKIKNLQIIGSEYKTGKNTEPAYFFYQGAAEYQNETVLFVIYFTEWNGQWKISNIELLEYEEVQS
ncbi:hypothetical protein C0583_06850 [Candidatus Parcubacteria bacterium]|nr:MAG: hypothetical protein C0583_06850 [Candidatus Parcubacteria bacterium]